MTCLGLTLNRQRHVDLRPWQNPLELPKRSLEDHRFGVNSMGRSALMVAAFIDAVRIHDMIAPHRMAERLQLPMAELARLAHVDCNTMAGESESPAVQAKLKEITRIISRAVELAGDEGRAIIWFRNQPIAGLGKTARELIKNGKIAVVFEELERMAAGVYS
jgi:hypothetical protein